MEQTIAEGINGVLNSYEKNKSEINYVSFYIGNYLQTRHRFYCSYTEFIDAVGIMKMKNIQWPYEIEVVAEKWWATFDMEAGWVIYEMPTKPQKYRAPTAFEMSNKDKHWTD